MANVDDYSGSAQLLAATTLRNVLGTRNLGDILADREAIAHEMQVGLDEATDSWGVLVERVEVKDHVYRMAIVEGRCTHLTLSSLHTYKIIG